MSIGQGMRVASPTNVPGPEEDETIPEAMASAGKCKQALFFLLSLVGGKVRSQNKGDNSKPTA